MVDDDADEGYVPAVAQSCGDVHRMKIMWKVRRLMEMW